MQSIFRFCTIRRFYLLPFWFLLVLTSCETTITPTNIPYTMQIVVRGILDAGVSIDSIKFTKTLPITEAYDSTLAFLPDVDATLTVDNTPTRLEHIGNGYYRAPNVIAETGKI